MTAFPPPNSLPGAGSSFFALISENGTDGAVEIVAFFVRLGFEIYPALFVASG
jgi:hypothetical protein